jgi:peptide-methionine (R)-S-oxide reductase
MNETEMSVSEAQWRSKLDPEHYQVLREKATERAFTGEYVYTKDDGVYRCAGCETPLFSSEDKYDSGCGWPAFSKPIADGAITYTDDDSFGMHRVEVTCSHCGGHLGHVFEDGPQPKGERYCINSLSLQLQKP